MVEATIRVQDPNVAYKAVNASRGKVTRAEPVAALYEQRHVHHAGSFPELEDQLCSFASDFDRARAGYSPDRVDALVWALTELMLGARQPTSWAAPISWRQSPSNPSSNPSFEGPVNAWGRFPG